MTEFLSPRPLAAGDRISEFSSGVEVLDRWLRTRARGNEKSGASRTMVSVTREGDVAGFYCLSSSALVRDDAAGELGGSQPDPVPVILIGRLAVDGRYERQGLGSSLLQHAVIRAMEAAEIIGTRAVVVFALSEDVVSFYQRNGFTLAPGQTRSLYLLASDARVTVESLASVTPAPDSRG